MTADFDLVGGLRFEPGAESSGGGRRQAFRVVPPGVTVRMEETLESFDVNNISASGVSMSIPEVRFEKGQELRFDLLIVGRLFLKGMEGRVARVVPGECACAFQNLSRHQELKLDNLVLEIQKRDIIRRKLEREAETASPDGASVAPEGGGGGTEAEKAPLRDGEGDEGAHPTIHLPL